MFDCHVHSSFSGDSDMKAEDACEQAIKLGLGGIAFTDHLDYDYPDFDEKFLINFDEYSRFMDDLKIKYKEKLKVLKGIEVGIQPHVVHETGQTVQRYDFDFVIASIHIIDQQDPYTGKYFKNKTKQEAFLRYLEVMLEGVRNYCNYDVIGHIGYIRRYCNYDDRSLRHHDFSDALDTILKTVISDGKGIEVNTSGCRTDIYAPIPDYDILRRYKELGGEILCMGSDAHFPEHVGSHFDSVKDELSNIGFKYLAYFEQRKPIFYKIS